MRKIDGVIGFVKIIELQVKILPASERKAGEFITNDRFCNDVLVVKCGCSGVEKPGRRSCRLTRMAAGLFCIQKSSG